MTSAEAGREAPHLVGLLAAAVGDDLEREALDLLVECRAEKQELHGLLRVAPQRLDHAHRIRREAVHLAHARAGPAAARQRRTLMGSHGWAGWRETPED